MRGIDAALAALLLAAPAGASDAVDAFPGAAASYLIVIDGRTQWARLPDAPRAPASLAKIMTALLVLEDKAWSPGARVAVSPRAAAATGARAGLRAGEAIGAGDALAALLLASGNDACVALAEHAAGSIERFVARMNARAAALGMTATRFEDPCGFDRPGQATTANDLLRLTAAALRHPEFERLVALEQAVVATAGGRELRLRNSNALLGRLDGARGVKTGYTAKAGRCLIALAERDGVRVLAVLLDAPDRWWSAAAVIEAAFDAARARR